MGDLRLGTTYAGLVKSHPLRAFGEKPLGALSLKRGQPFTKYVRVVGDSKRDWGPFM